VSASLLSFLFALYAAIAPGGTRVRVQPELMSQQEMEVRVRIDAARNLKVDFDDVRVLQVTGQTWPDERLGCSPRKPEVNIEVEPDPTPGFSIVVKAKTSRVTYHTDRTGRVLRCAKPDRISKPTLTASVQPDR
jgi:hypothetical protein